MSDICTGDWMRLHCGDRVRERDGRHVGRVESIEHGAWVWVKWEDTGWLSKIALADFHRGDYVKLKFDFWRQT